MATSWFGSVLQAAKHAISAQGEDFVLEELDQQRHGVQAPSREIEKDRDYVTIRVKSSRIVDVRRWTTTFYGCIQSRAHYLHTEKGLVEYQTVLVPDKMRGLDPANVDRVVEIDKPVLGPVPYIGGLSLELGLFSVKGSDLAAPYIDLLTSIAQQAGVAFLGAAVPYVEPLRKGADLLFGNNRQSELEIGVDRGWTDLRTGYWLLMRAPKGRVDPSELRVDPKDFALTDLSGQPYRRYPYVILGIEASRRRDDWMTVPELKGAWDAIGAAARKGKLDDAAQLLRQFTLIAKWSPDLVPDDGDRLVEKAQAQLPTLRTGAGGALKRAMDSFPDFAGLDLYGAR